MPAGRKMPGPLLANRNGRPATVNPFAMTAHGKTGPWRMTNRRNSSNASLRTFQSGSTPGDRLLLVIGLISCRVAASESTTEWTRMHR